MKKIQAVSALIVALGALMSGNAYAASAPKPPGFGKVLVVILENTDFEQAIGQETLSKLAAQGALLADFHGESHPSQPNYFALISGSTQGISDDRPHEVNAKTIADLLDAKGKTWKAYLEGYPGHCFSDSTEGQYVRKHNPFISFSGVAKDPKRCARLVSASELEQDVKEHSLPDFALYTPDLRNDGHDTGAAYASHWLAERFLPKLGKRLPRDLLLVVTFDESGNSSEAQGNHIYTALLGSSVRPGTRSAVRYNHYSLLRMIEERFGLGNLGAGDATAQGISDVWR
jgi:acid phosphatase